MIVVMTKNAIDRYGEGWRGVRMLVTHTATKYMPASEFYTRGEPNGYHPGYDSGVGGKLYDLRRVDNGKAVPFSLYDYEVRAVEGANDGDE